MSVVAAAILASALAFVKYKLVGDPSSAISSVTKVLVPPSDTDAPFIVIAELANFPLAIEPANIALVTPPVVMATLFVLTVIPAPAPTANDLLAAKVPPEPDVKPFPAVKVIARIATDSALKFCNTPDIVLAP